MPEDKKSVSGSDSLSENDPELPSSQGDGSSKNGDRSIEQVMAENKRKSEKIVELQEQLMAEKAYLHADAMLKARSQQ